MESLAEDFKLISKGILKELQIGKLPNTVQACLIAIEGTHAQAELFNIADKLHNSTESPKISTITQQSSANDNLSEQIFRILNGIRIYWSI